MSETDVLVRLAAHWDTDTLRRRIAMGEEEMKILTARIAAWRSLLLTREDDDR